MKQKADKKKTKTGAKSKYNPETFPLLAEGYARNGLNDKQIAKNLGITFQSYYAYQHKHIEFFEAIKRGKRPVDTEVENALLKRAIGYEYEEVTEEVEYDKNGNVRNTTTKKTIKKVAPDVGAIAFWLKNRRPAEWKDKQIMDHQFNNGIVINQPGYEPLQLESGKEVQTIEVTANES